MEASVGPGDGGRRRPLSFAPTAATAVFCAGLVLGSLVVHNGGLPAVSLISLSPPVVYTPAAQLQDFSITIPSTWRRGTQLGVKVRHLPPRRLPLDLCRTAHAHQHTAFA